MSRLSTSRVSRRTILCRSGIAAALLAGALALPLIGGCGASDEPSTTAPAASSAANSTSSTSASASPADGEVSTSPSSASFSSARNDVAKTGASSSTADGSAAVDGSAAADNFSYSDYLDDTGRWRGIDAASYVTLPADYAAIPVPQSMVTPTADAVQQQIDSIVANFGVQNKVTDRAVADGDTVNIDYVGKIDGQEFDGGSTGGKGTTVTIGVTQYIDDFLEQLVGHKPGETFDVNVTFPETYGVDELNGKDATFTVTINYISETSLPNVSDEWVASTMGTTYGWQSVDDMRAGISDTLFKNNLTTYVQNYLLNNAEISEIPQEMIDAQTKFFVAHYRGMASSYGMDFSSMLQMLGATDEDDLVAKSESTIQSLARQFLVFQAAADDAGLSVSDEEARAYLTSALGATTDEAVNNYLAQYGMEYAKMNALVQKVSDLLVSGAQLVEDEGETGAGSSAADASGASDVKAVKQASADRDSLAGDAADSSQADASTK